MVSFLNSAPGIITMIGAFCVLAIGGVLAVIGMWDKQSRDRKKKVSDDLDHSEDRLVDILKRTVGELETKVNQQTIDIAALTKKIESLEHENETVIKVLQGRDEQTQKYFQEGFATMKVVKDIREEQLRQSDAWSKSNEIQAKLLDLLSKHINVIDHTIIKPGPNPA